MTDHPITPPPELVERILDESETCIEMIRRAYAAGSDQELEACCEWLDCRGLFYLGSNLRTTRRPQPPSLKEQALDALKHAEEGWRPVPADCDIIRRALEALDD